MPRPSGQWHRSVWTMLWRPTINYLLTHLLLTYVLTSCSRVPLEKPTGSQIVKNFPALYEKRKFIAAVTTARHLSLNYIIIYIFTYAKTKHSNSLFYSTRYGDWLMWFLLLCSWNITELLSFHPIAGYRLYVCSYNSQSIMSPVKQQISMYL